MSAQGVELLADLGLDPCGHAALRLAVLGGSFVATTREVLGLPEQASLALEPQQAVDAAELFETRARQTS